MLIPNESVAAPSCYDAFKEEKSAPIDNQNISNHDAVLSAPLAAVSPNFSNFQNTPLQHASTMVPNNYQCFMVMKRTARLSVGRA